MGRNVNVPFKIVYFEIQSVKDNNYLVYLQLNCFKYNSEYDMSEQINKRWQETLQYDAVK